VPLPTSFVVKKGSNTREANGFGNSCPGVGHRDFRAITSCMGANGDASLPAILDFVSESVGCVHDQVQNDLVYFTEVTRHQGEICIETRFDIGVIFPLVAGNRDGGFNSLVEVRRSFFVGIGMGKLF
jgi:hypothetical protein